MVLLFSVTLSISILGIISLLGIKQWEIATGSVLGARVRPAVGRFFYRVQVWVVGHMPRLIKVYSRAVVRTTLAYLHWLSAHIVLLVEQLLERLLLVLRRATAAPRGEGEVSVFLREVAEHKKRLLKSTRVPARTPVHGPGRQL